MKSFISAATTVALLANVAFGQGIPGASQPPDGEAGLGVVAASSALINTLQNAPTAVDLENGIIGGGKRYVFDFVNSPILGAPGQGGFFTLASQGNWPAATENGMAVAYFVLSPCGMIGPHVHPRGDEWLYLATGGPMRFGLNFEAGGPVQYEFLQTGQAVMLPKGSMHYGGVLGCDPTFVVAMFDNADPGFNLAHFAFFGFDNEAISASLGMYGVEPVSASTFPGALNIGFEGCLERCGITRDYDISSLSKLQIMQAAFSAYTARVVSGNRSTFTPGAYVNGPQDYAPAVPEILQVQGSQTIGNVSAIFADGKGGIFTTSTNKRRSLIKAFEVISLPSAADEMASLKTLQFLSGTLGVAALFFFGATVKLAKAVQGRK